MPLSLEQATQSLERVCVLQNIHTSDRAAYVQTIYEGCGWMSGYRFELVVKAICLELKGNVRLKSGHFIAQYREMSAQNGWDREERKTCSVCGGCGLIAIYLRRKSTGEIHRAMTPCDHCKQVTVNRKDVDPDLESAEAPPPPKPEDYRVKPHIARYLLDTIDKATWANFKSEWVARLCELAAADQDPKDLGRALVVQRVAVPRLNEPKRKNEIVRALIEAEAGRAGGVPATTEPQTSPEERPSPAPPSEEEWEAIHPAVADVPEEKRKRLDAQATDEDVPF